MILYMKKLTRRNKTKTNLKKSIKNKCGGAARLTSPREFTNTCSSELFHNLFNNEHHQNILRILFNSEQIFINPRDVTPVVIKQPIYQLLTPPLADIVFMLNQTERGVYLNCLHSYIDNGENVYARILHISIHPGLFQTECDVKGNMHIMFDLPDAEEPKVVRLSVRYDPDQKKKIVFRDTRLPMGYNPFKLEIIDIIIKLLQKYVDENMQRRM